jgi:hypothetical protein
MKSLARVLVLVGIGAVLVACGSGPSKSQAFEAIQSGIKEEGNCVLPVDFLGRVKMQHTTKGICVPKEGADKARACVDALVAAGVTHRMPDAYMLAWPDEVTIASLTEIPAYERRPRSQIYATCVELVGELRDGRFSCADVRAEKVIKVTATDDTHADVRYERELKLKPSLAAIEAACGNVTRPPGESSVPFVKGASGWTLASAAGAGDGGAP